jgi:hypothetical protein
MPTLNLSAAINYQFVVNMENVSVFDKFGNNNATDITAKRLPQDVREREISKGEYLQTDVDWRLPSALVGSPQPGWTIIDSDSIAYVIIDIDPPGTYGNWWRCACRTVNILGLYNTVDWRIVNQTTDSYGDRITDPTTFVLGAGGLPARIQPMPPRVADRLRKRGFVARFHCYVLPDLALTFGDIIIDTSNNNQQYKVVSWESKQDLACALKITVEIMP